jgi:hypothetical protein
LIYSGQLLFSFTTLYFLCNFHGPNKLEHCITPGWKSLPVTNTLAYRADSCSVGLRVQCFAVFSLLMLEAVARLKPLTLG